MLVESNPIVGLPSRHLVERRSGLGDDLAIESSSDPARQTLVGRTRLACRADPCRPQFGSRGRFSAPVECERRSAGSINQSIIFALD
jgi:hypothetical protein